MNIKDSSPFFSIIIPVYNVERYISKCVESVLSQTFRDFEIILVDDGSTDASGNICDNFSLSQDKIKVIHKKNGGAASARNDAIGVASGKYLVFLDGDDYWDLENGLQIIYDRIRKYGNDVVLLGCIEKDLDSSYSAINRGKYDLSIFNNKDKSQILNYLYSSGNFPGAAWVMVVEKNLISNNNIRFPEGVTAEDVVWVNEILISSNSIGAINDLIYIYIQNRPGQITSLKLRSGIEGYILAFQDWEVQSKNLEYMAITNRMAHIFLAMLMLYSNLNKSDREELSAKVKNCSYIFKVSNKLYYKILNTLFMKLGPYFIGKSVFLMYGLKNKLLKLFK